MNKSTVPALLLALLVSFPAFGQIGGLVGRYFDNFANVSPYRITDVYVAPEIDRVFAIPTSPSTLFVGWKLSTFAADAAANSQVLMTPAMQVDPSDSSQGWSYIAIDGSGLEGFDYDVRGYVYLSYGINGFGIVDSNGHLIVQINSEWTHQIKLLQSGGHDYLVVNAAGGTRVYDVTDPATPQLVRTIALPFSRMAAAGTNVAVIVPGEFRIYNVDTLLNGGAPLQTFAGIYDKVVTDGTHFFATGLSSLSTFTLAGGTWTPSTITYTNRIVRTVHWGNGALVITLFRTTGFPTAAGILYTVHGDTLVPTDLTASLGAIYPTAPLAALNVIANGAQHYLITSIRTRGDVFSLDANIFPAAASLEIPNAPTLSEWGLIALAIGLAAITAMRLRA